MAARVADKILEPELYCVLLVETFSTMQYTIFVELRSFPKLFYFTLILF